MRTLFAMLALVLAVTAVSAAAQAQTNLPVAATPVPTAPPTAAEPAHNWLNVRCSGAFTEKKSQYTTCTGSVDGKSVAIALTILSVTGEPVSHQSTGQEWTAIALPRDQSACVLQAEAEVDGRKVFTRQTWIQGDNGWTHDRYSESTLRALHPWDPKDSAKVDAFLVSLRE